MTETLNIEESKCNLHSLFLNDFMCRTFVKSELFRKTHEIRLYMVNTKFNVLGYSSFLVFLFFYEVCKSKYTCYRKLHGCMMRFRFVYYDCQTVFNFTLKLWSLAFLIENEQKHEFLFGL